MKKTVVVFAILLVSVFAVFAEWQEGYFVDDFGDRTGESCALLLTEGTFSNSATSGSKAYIRVIADVDSIVVQGESLPTLGFGFELHTYSWDNPAESFYKSSTAKYQFKDEQGNVLSFSSKQPWDVVSGVSAAKLYSLLLNNKMVRCVITVESYKFSFTIGCTGFKEQVNDLYTPVQPSFTFDEYIDSHAIFYDYSANIWCRYDCWLAKLNIKLKVGENNGYTAPSSTTKFEIYVSDLLYVNEQGLYFDCKSDVWHSSFAVGWDTEDPLHVRSSDEVDKLKSVLASKPTCDLKLFMKEFETITFKLDSAKLLKELGI